MIKLSLYHYIIYTKEKGTLSNYSLVTLYYLIKKVITYKQYKNKDIYQMD